MPKSLAIVFAFVALVFAGVAFAAAPPPTVEKNGFDFNDARGAVELGSWLKPYHAPASVVAATIR